MPSIYDIRPNSSQNMRLDNAPKSQGYDMPHTPPPNPHVYHGAVIHKTSLLTSKKDPLKTWPDLSLAALILLYGT